MILKKDLEETKTEEELKNERFVASMLKNMEKKQYT